MTEFAMQNAFPQIFNRLPDRVFTKDEFLVTDLIYDTREIFDFIRDIKDPEHPMTLEELAVVDIENIQVDDTKNSCCVMFKPTIPHCSMATLIGLSIKVQLLRVMPSRFKIDVCTVPGTHVMGSSIDKQLADKERIAAALENKYLHDVIDDCLLYPEDEIQTIPKFIENFLAEANSLNNPKVKYIQRSRQHIETYRHWKDIVHEDRSKNADVKLKKN